MPSTAELSANTIRVKLVKQKHGGLGFLVKQRTLKPFVLVASIVKGGVAEESGLVQIGDIILRINDIDLTDMSYPSAIEVLKAVPIDTPVVLLLRGPEGYTTYLQTSFLENGMPRTVRVTKPIHESIMGRIKKTFSGTSGPISPVKGLKRLCNGEIDGKHKQDCCEGTDKDVDSTGGDDEGFKDLVTVEEFEKDAAAKSAPPIHHGNGGVFGIGKKILSSRDRGAFPAGEASKFLFRNEGRVDSEEGTVLDNGAVGSPKIVLTSPKSNLTKDGQRIATMSRALTHDSCVSESCRGQCQKKAIEIVQDEDEITVVVRGDVSVRSEDLSSTDPNIPKRFIISSTRHRDGNASTNNTNNINSNNNNISHTKENCESNHNNNIVSSNNNTSLSRSGSKKKSGRSSPTSGGRASPTGNRRSRSPVTSPTKHAGDDDFGKGRGSEKKRTPSPTFGRRKSGDRRSSIVASGMASPKKFAKVKNLLDDKSYIDTLHQKVITTVPCNSERCMGSLMSQQAHRAATTPRSCEELLVHAKDFIEQYYTSIKRNSTPAHQKRWVEIQDSVDRSGTYELTTAELNFGAKLAWRNAPRCIGRIQWAKLQVFDARHILTARGMYEALCNHIKYATNKGNLRSAITIFPQRKDGRRDFRVWNVQLIRYGGYKMEDGSIMGDPANVEFTEQCVKIGWKPKYGRFDVLPLVLSAAGSDPEWFEVPPELILEVNMKHPKYPWFADLGLKWYALPAVSGMMFDCGGLEFPACPFNGWYMGTEIGARDFCDASRYNMLEIIATKMGLDIRKSSSLWKDRALVECNVAVLHSFQSCGVTITDHHAASESFIKHMDNEHKLRGGCPADWVWVVPPMSGSILEVFHQEMLLYKLKPSYEYQDDAWKTHVWKKDRDKTKTSDKPKRKFGFKELARAVKFSAKLMGKALARRVKCVILYATETGKSERFANTLCEIFKHAFDAKVMCMSDCDVISLEHESLVLVVTSTFGNGDPPENGEAFAKSLYEMKSMESTNGDTNSRTHSSYVRMSISSDKEVKLDLDMTNPDSLAMITGPLGNVRFSVFALGSKAYPHFAAFGHYMDKILHELGSERIFPLAEGDELCGQEQSFRQWAEGVFTAACETFCLGDDVNINEATGALNNADHSWTPNRFRITSVDPKSKEPNICEALSSLHGKRVLPCVLTERTHLQSEESDRQTILVKLNTQGADELVYVPGDHVGVFPANAPDLVDAILTRLHNAPPPDQIIKTEFLHEVSTPLGTNKTWTLFEKMPVCSMRMAFTHILDVTTPPPQSLLQLLATQTTREMDKTRLELLATDASEYENWKYDFRSNILELLDQFSSLRVAPSLLLTQLPLLQQRYYSISSSPQMFPGEIHGTVAVVRFRTQDGAGPVHEGVCSGWLNGCTPGTTVPCLVRAAPTFHLPDNPSLPVIMVGPGTGIAPFRSFWQQRSIDLEMMNVPSHDDRKVFGEMSLYFGCRTKLQDNIYGKELEEMKNQEVLASYYVALSRELDMPKAYVQDILLSKAEAVHEAIVKRGGHFYVCGDVSMAHDVTQTLEAILQEQGQMSAEDACNFVTKLRDTNRFHEDIFGVNFGRPGDHAERSKDQSLRALQYLNAFTRVSRPDAVKEKAVPIPASPRSSWA
uniref:Nitric oxide synthase 1 n=1 Tax=Ambigolimax valentianus TaxID=1338344 RepID=A7BJS9_9EUPU|nr:nitric oxide synthase [Ambigolimax valentianus]